MIQAGDIVGIGPALEEKRNLRIPEYQRNYNWEKENVDDFWDDLIQSIESNQDHYFGTLIIESDGSSGAPKDIVDGQQRLTTVLVLVARLRDELTRIDPGGRIVVRDQSFSLLDDLNKMLNQHPDSIVYVPNSLIRDTFEELCRPPKYEYTTQADRKNDYEGRTIRKNSTRSDANATLSLRNTYYHLKQLVKSRLDEVSFELPPEEAIEAKKREIHAIWKTLKSNFKVLPITTTSQQESLEVFLTTNDRGMDLGIMDLIRGQILEVQVAGAADERERTDILERHAEALQTITKNVGTTKQIDQFLRHWLHLHEKTVELLDDGSTKYTRLTVRKIPDFTKEIISGSEDRDLESGNLWRFIRHGADIYPVVVNPNPDTGDNKTRLRLLALKSVAASYRIFAFRVFDPEIDLAKKSKAELINELLKLVFKWTLAGANAQDLEILLHKLAHKVLNDSSVSEVADSMRLERSRISLPMEDIAAVTATESWNRGILFALEAEAVRPAGLIDSYEVEHIAPQTPNDHWMDQLRTDTRNEYKKWVSQLGNLTLLDGPINNETKQNPFAAKQKDYGESNVALAKTLANWPNDDWNTESISARSNELTLQLSELLES